MEHSFCVSGARGFCITLALQPFIVRGLESHCWFGGKGFVWAEGFSFRESGRCFQMCFSPEKFAARPQTPKPYKGSSLNWVPFRVRLTKVP